MLKIGCKIARCQAEVGCGVFDTCGKARPLSAHAMPDDPAVPRLVADAERD
jgi:hypothetical protein